MAGTSRHVCAICGCVFLAATPGFAGAATAPRARLAGTAPTQPADHPATRTAPGHTTHDDVPTPGSTPKQAVPLKAVEVTGTTTSQSYNPPVTTTATRTDTSLLNIAQSIQVIPRQLLVDQGAQSLAAAMRNAPGVYVQQGEGNRDEFYIRGVKTKSDFFVDGLRDDSEYYRPLYNIAHVDVLQGPAAILFGRGGAGGIINLVTRKPERKRIRHVSVEAGTWNQWRGSMDVGGPMGSTGAFRVMAMAEHAGGFRDYDYLQRHAVNPEVGFTIGGDTAVELGASLLDDRRRADRGIPSRNGRPASVPRDTFFGAPGQNVAHSRVSTFKARVRHAVSDDLYVRNAFLVTENQRMYQNVYPGSAVDDAGMLKLKAYHHPSNRLSYLDRAELVANFDGGTMQHTLLAGAEFGWQRGNDKETLPGPSKTLPGTWPVDDAIVAPVAFPYLDRNNHVVGKELGVYAEDQVSFGDHWKALLGVRWDRFSVDARYYKPGVTPDHTHHVDTDWSPRIGVIYKPVDNDSIYASVTRTFTPQGANIALSQKSPDTAALAPELATNYEIGNKIDFRDGDVSFTAALFQLELKDVVSKAADGSGRLVNTGRQRNRGVELSLAGALTEHLSVRANYTHLAATITSATKDAAAGARVGLVPRDQCSLWARYAFNPHWGVGAGMRAAASKYTSYDNGVVLPGFAEADLMAWYQFAHVRIQLNIDNVTDRTYYATASGDNEIMPGAPRHVGLSLSMDF